MPAGPAATARRAWGRSSACPPRRSPRSSGAPAPHGCHGPPGLRSFASSAPGPASCCTSTPSAWGAFTRSASGSLPTASSARLERAGSTCTWPSTTAAAYCEVLPGQGAEHSCAFLERAVGWFTAEHGIGIERVLSDNGHAYRSHAWAATCERLGIERRRTRPYTPRTNCEGASAALDGRCQGGVDGRGHDSRTNWRSARRGCPLADSSVRGCRRRPGARTLA